MDANIESVLDSTVSRLLTLAHSERGALFFHLPSNSPFSGWGSVGRFETTGLVVTALSACQASRWNKPNLDTTIRQGKLFLLRGRDPARAWNSSQASLHAIQALAAGAAHAAPARNGPELVEIYTENRLIKTVPLAADPVFLDLSPYLAKPDTEFTIVPQSGAATVVQLVSSHWIPWAAQPNPPSPEIRFNVEFDRLAPHPGQPLRCTVHAERVGFRGYGMLIAEVGLPPGAQVDRSSLEPVLEDPNLGVHRYEIQPDRVLFYLSPRPGGARFHFYFTLRFPIHAQSAPSLLYDYYNPEAALRLAPTTWRVLP